MKKPFLLFFFFITVFTGHTQSLDSILSIPQTLELKISTPQPRLKEKFQITLDLNYIRAQIFRSAAGKFKLEQDMADPNDGLMVLNVIAPGKGRQVIGPLEFTINGTKYSTNKIEYDVADALPKTDKGLWFRKVITSDSTFSIIIEQRIPMKNAATPETTLAYLTSPSASNQFVAFTSTETIIGLTGGNLNTSYTDFGSITDNAGTQKDFMSSYSITGFRITDKKKKIVITKDKFTNLPADYAFENITVQ